MKDPNDFMLVESEGEQVKRLAAELAELRKHLGTLTPGGSHTCITCAAHVKVITEDLEPRSVALEVELGAANSAVFRTSGELDIAVRRIRSLEVDLIKTKQERNDELRLRQTAEAYAARNALRVIAVEAALRDLLDDLSEDVGQRHHRDKYRVYQVGPQTIEAARALLPALETACTCDSTLVTDTSNHQPHCPRYVAETAGVKP